MEPQLLNVISILAASLAVIVKVVTDMKIAKKHNGGAESLKTSIEVLRLEIAELRSMVESIRAAFTEHSKWIAEHDGRTNAWWEQQRKFNEAIEKKLAEIQRV